MELETTNPLLSNDIVNIWTKVVPTLDNGLVLDPHNDNNIRGVYTHFVWNHFYFSRHKTCVSVENSSSYGAYV